MHRTVLTVTAGIAILGCSVVLDPNRPQCTSDADCTNRGPAFNGTVCVDSFCQASTDTTWGCAGNPAPDDVDAGPFHASLIVLDGVKQMPLAGIEAQLCLKLDIDCATPLTSPVYSDANGLVDFVVGGGFDGYVVLTDPTIAPTLYFFNPPVVADTVPTQVSVFSPSNFTLLAQQVGVTLLPNRGIIILTAEDCEGNPSAGVSFSDSTGDAMTAAFYTVGSLPTATAQSTESNGYAGLANVPAGVAAVTGTLVSNQQKLGTISLLVRGSAITYSQWAPLAD